MDEIPPAEAFEPQPDEVVGAGRLRRRVQVAVTLVLVAALVALAAIEGSGYIIRGDGIETTPPPASAPPGARLAAVDSAGALTTIDVSDGSVVSYPVPGVAFQFPAWSPDGSRIAAIGQAADGTGVYVFTARAAGTTATDPLVVYRSPDRPPFYLYWTPDSRLLTFLTTEPDGLALRIAPADAGASASVVRAGAPMYWDFVDSGRLLVHSGAPGPDAFLGEVGVDGGALQPSDASPGLFRAPAISGDGRYRAYVTGTGAATGEVVIETGDGSRVQQVRMFGPAALSFSSQGHELAFLAPSQATNRALPVPIGPLRIVGTDPGEPRTLPGGNVVAFFWSPSGKEIAVLRLDTTDTNVTQASGRGGAVLAAAKVAAPAGAGAGGTGAGGVRLGAGGVRLGAGAGGAGGVRLTATGQLLRLMFVEVADGSVRSDRVVRLSDMFVNQVLPFFDQYALSHRFWSPDSAAVVLPILSDAGATQLIAMPADGSEPRAIATGEMGFWSP